MSLATPNKPTVPTSKPPNLKFVRAYFGYKAQDPDELSFEEGDLLYIVDDKTTPDWWRARCRGKEGFVPANYLTNSRASEAVDFSPLHDACRRGNLNLLDECLANRVPVNATDKVGNTPLHWSALGGHLDCLHRLLSIGPALKLSPINRLGETPLHLAAARGNVEVILALRKADENLDFNLKNFEGKTPLDVSSDPATRAELKRWMASSRNETEKASTAEYNHSDYAESDDEEQEHL